MKVPFLDLGAAYTACKAEYDQAYERVMKSGWFILGPEVEAFEREYAEYSNVNHAIGVGNGLDALHLLLKAYGIGPGDEVIVPANTFIATYLAVSFAGATPVPAEADPNTYTLTGDAVRSRISKKTKAVMPVHLYGQPCDMDGINSVAAENDLIVIEDAAQSQGALYKNRQCGSLGDAAGTSFYPGKNLGAFGDAGCVLTSDTAIAESVRKLRNYGSSVKYHHDELGSNSRLDELQAAFLRVKLRYLDEWNGRRANVAARYLRELDKDLITLPSVPDWAKPVWHLFVVRVKDRARIQHRLNEAGIATMVHYPIPGHLQKCYSKDYSGQVFQQTESQAQELLSLPISPFLTESQLTYTIENLNAAVRS